MKSHYHASKKSDGGKGVGIIAGKDFQGYMRPQTPKLFLKRNASSKLFHNQHLRFQLKPTLMGSVCLNTHLKEEKGGIR